MFGEMNIVSGLLREELFKICLFVSRNEFSTCCPEEKKGVLTVWFTVISVSPSLSNCFSCCLSSLLFSSSNSHALCGIRILLEPELDFYSIETPF